MNTLNKKTIRRQAQAARLALPPALTTAAQQRIIAHIKRLPTYRNAQHIAFYHAIAGEIDLSPLLDDAQANGLTYYLPRINTDATLSFYPMTNATPTKLNRFGIPEPDGPDAHARSPADMDLMFIPLVAFDLHGTRLGRGGGYYDRTLVKTRPGCLLGVAYAVQCYLFLPREDWDVTLDGVITELAIHRFNQ